MDYDGQSHLQLEEPEQPDTDQLFAKAEAAEAEGDFSTSEGLYRRCLSLDRSDPTISFNLANVLREQGRDNEARVLLQTATKLDRHFPEAWYNLADLEEKAGDLTGAKSCLNRAIDADPDYADAIFNLAWLQYQSGEFEASSRNWERYLRFDQSSDWAVRAQETLALCRRQSGAHGEAEG